MITAAGLIIVVVVLYEIRSILRKRIDHAAAKGIFTSFKVRKPLGAHGRFLLIAGIFAVLTVKVTFCVDTGHVIHGGSHSRLDAGIKRRCIQRHAAPAANAYDADAFRIDLVAERQKVDCCHIVFGVDIRRSHVTDVAAAFTGKGRVKSDREKPSFSHGLRVETGTLFLYGAEGSADRDGRKFALRILRDIHICRQSNAVAVHECNFAMIHLVAFRESLVPFLCQCEFFLPHHDPFPRFLIS